MPTWRAAFPERISVSGAPVSSSTSICLPPISMGAAMREAITFTGSTRSSSASTARGPGTSSGRGSAPCARKVDLDHVVVEEVAAEEPVLPARLRAGIAAARVDPELEVAPEARAAAVGRLLGPPHRDAELSRHQRGEDARDGAGVEHQPEGLGALGREIDQDAVGLVAREERERGDHRFRRRLGGAGGERGRSGQQSDERDGERETGLCHALLIP